MAEIIRGSKNVLTNIWERRRALPVPEFLEGSNTLNVGLVDREMALGKGHNLLRCTIHSLHLIRRGISPKSLLHGFLTAQSHTQVSLATLV